MSLTAQSSHLFSSQIVYSATLSSEKSKAFVRKLIPTAIASIIYQRTDFNRGNFRSSKYKGITFYNFRGKLQSKLLRRLYHVIKGAIEAFDNNYLRELYLIFVTNDESRTVLESYNFRLEYTSNLDSSNSTPTTNSIKQSTLELLQSIEKLRSFNSILKRTMMIPQLCITYCEDITPPDYHPPGFSSPNDKCDNIVNMISNISMNYVEFGFLKTCYHSVLCRYQLKKELENAKEVMNLNECENLNINSQLSTESIKDDCLKIDCFCCTSGIYKSIDLVECKNCLILEHVPCLGYLDRNDVEKPYYCEKCKCCTSKSSTPKDLQRRQCLSIYRLSLAYIYFNMAFPNEILNKIKDSLRVFIIKKLSFLELIEETVDGYSLNEKDFAAKLHMSLSKVMNIKIDSEELLALESDKCQMSPKRIKIF